MFRLCYIAPSVPLPGFHGGSTHVYEISRNLVKMGFEVHVLARRLPGQQAFDIVNGIYLHRIYRGIIKEKSIPKTRIVRLKGKDEILRKMTPLFFKSIYLPFVTVIALQIIKRHGIDVILERGDSRGIGGLVSFLTKKPLIVEVRDEYQSLLSIERAKYILAYEPSIVRDKTARNKTVIMSGGVDVDLFNPNIDGLQVRQRYGLSGKQVIGYVGAFYPWHDIENIIATAKNLVSIFDVRFLMVGPNFQRAQELVEKWGLDDYFIFVGPVPYEDVPKYISACDVMLALFSFPQMMSGPPYKVFEYLACGKVVIATKTLYTARYIKDGANGFLIAPNDLDSLVSRLRVLLKGEVLRKTIGDNARKSIITYSWQNEARKIVNIIERVLNS